MSVFLSKMVRINFYSHKQKQIICCYADTSKIEGERNLESIRNKNGDECNKEEVNRNNGENKSNVNEIKPSISSGFKRTKTKHHK